MKKILEDAAPAGVSTADMAQFTPKISLGATDDNAPVSRRKMKKIKRFKKWLADEKS